MNRWITGVAILVLAAPTAVVAGPGTTASDVFSFARSARLEVLGMGTALPGDATALARNAAALGGVEELSAAITYQDWYVDTSVTRASLAGPGPIGGGAFAVDVVYLSESEVLDLDPETGTFTDRYSNDQFGLAAGYGAPLPWVENVDFGGQVQFARRRLLDESASTVGIGAGLAAGWWGGALRAGISLNNLATDTDFGGGAEPAEWGLAGGLALRVGPGDPESVRGTLCTDIVKTRSLDVGATIGGEIEIGTHVALRIGYDGTTEDAAWRYGIGLAVGGWVLDYALVEHETLGGTDTVSLRHSFGR